MKKIETKKAPQAIGPYSQAIVASPFLFLSGMLPIHPEEGRILESSIEGQTKQVLINIEQVLIAAGVTLKEVVKMEVFLKDLAHFQAMNQIYAEKFPHEIKPARHAFQVACLPLGALIEITCTALCKKEER